MAVKAPKRKAPGSPLARLRGRARADVPGRARFLDHQRRAHDACRWAASASSVAYLALRLHRGSAARRASAGPSSDCSRSSRLRGARPRARVLDHRSRRTARWASPSVIERGAETSSRPSPPSPGSRSLAVSSLPILFAERALLPHAPRRAHRRPARAVGRSRAGSRSASRPAYGALFTYAAGELDSKADFSYFRTARPSESTKNIVKAWPSRSRSSHLLPSAQRRGREVGIYLKELGRASPKFVTRRTTGCSSRRSPRTPRSPRTASSCSRAGRSRETLNLGVEMKRPAQAEDARRRFPEDPAQGLARDAHSRTSPSGTARSTSRDDAEGRTANGVRKLFEIAELRGQGPRARPGPRHRDPQRRHHRGGARSCAPAPARGGRHPQEIRRSAAGTCLLALDPDAKVDLDPLADDRRAHVRNRPSWPTTRSTCGGGSTTRTARSWSPTASRRTPRSPR